MTDDHPYDEVDISSLAFWSKSADERELSFRELRELRPISWHRPAEGGLLPPSEGGGFWGVVSHRDITTVSRHPEIFSSGSGVMLEDLPPEVAEAAQSFLAMDAPRHTLLRRLVNLAFSPRQVARIEEQIRRQSATIVDDLLNTGDCDFVAHVSQRLPAWTIAEMMGVDEVDRNVFMESANALVGWNDPIQQAGREPLTLLFEALIALHGIAISLTEERRVKPQDDLMSALVSAEVDGEILSDPEIAAFFVLLAVAGNDTTRNTISHGMKALCDHPAERQMLVSDFDTHIKPAVEEMVRWATPVMTFRRTVTSTTELGGQEMRAGEHVVMFYSSGNRDEAVFHDPNRFDITRVPNEHVGFGGGGPHFCLGASLARTQLRNIFDELLHKVPQLEVGPPVQLVGNFINGIMTMPCTLKS